MAAVDILLTAYNAASTLRETLDSVRAQTFADFRIVIVDDGSTDATAQILAEYAASDSRFFIVTQPNGGLVAALNHGLSHCTAEFIARLDSDDVALPQRLERQLAYLEAHPACVAVGSQVTHIDENGAPLTGLPDAGEIADADASHAPAREPYVVHSTLMARRAAVEAIGGYRYAPNCEDSDLFWRLSERGALACIAEALLKYRVHSASISSTIVNGRIMAIGSQLSALSALRRTAGRADIDFAPKLTAELRQAGTLEKMWELAAPMLNADEAEHLRIAAAAKLMELARYRPYELDAGDCAFIRAALTFARRLAPQNQREVNWYLTVTAARLIRKGLLAEAFTLTPPASYPVAAARVLLAR
ncbi:MAG: glycosyltransferase family 2 protein [Phycisphaerales bacterium]|nr:glycosyltransferase family 2 protein [Hyphomonadaceae bacterium]